jgi:hypothetical protein
MPFKSKAQRERARRQMEEGVISKEMFDKWNEGTPEDLPERLHPKKEEKKEEKKGKK